MDFFNLRTFNNNRWIGVYQKETATAYNQGWCTVRNNTPANNQGFKNKIEPVETYSLEYTHTITQLDVDAGGISNTISVIANSHNVTDTSDDGDDTDGNLIDDQTGVPIDTVRAILITKTATVSDVDADGVNSVGDIITYTISVTNSGTVNLSSYSISDTLTDGNSTTLSFTGNVSYVFTEKKSVFDLSSYSNFWQSPDPNYNGTAVAYIWSSSAANDPQFFDDYSSNAQNWSSLVERDDGATSMSGYSYLASYEGHVLF